MAQSPNTTNFETVAVDSQKGFKVNGVTVIDENGNINEASGIVLSNGDSFLDSNGNEMLKFAVTASAVNEVTFTNAATGNAPSISATGGDTNIGVTLKGKGTGAVTLGQATSTGVVLAASQPLMDANSNELFKFSATGSAVNEFTVTNSATGNAPSITATGGDTNIDVTFAGKGTGSVNLGQATSTGVKLVASQPILDENANELFKFVATGSAVNEVTVTNAATGNNPNIAATGGDSNISLSLTAKGTGNVLVAGGRGIASSVSNGYTPFIKAVAAQSLSGAGAITVTQYKTNLTTTGADALTLANGDIIGQLKLIQMIVDGGDGTLTPTSLSGGTTITFADVGDCALLMWNGTAWVAIDLYNIADGATAPVLA